MTKQDSLVLKGVAILLMLFYHLFVISSNTDSYVNFFSIGGLPLSSILTRACNPVPFFLILSGFGLYISHQKGAYNVWRKLKGLYVHYWITLLIFVTIGSFVMSDKYPGSIMDMINNTTGWDTSYNGEVWFLFPYAMVMLTSKWLVRVLDRYNLLLCLGVTFFLSMCTGYVISRFGLQYLFSNQLLYKPVLYIQFLFAFSIGAYMAKYKDILFDLRRTEIVATGGGRSKGFNVLTHPIAIWMLLVALIVIRCCFKTGVFHTLYVAVFILIFVNAPRPKALDAFLVEMGKRSTSMWFVHSYFCYYLFHDWIYGFRYPLLIFAILLACSYASAVVIDWINGRVKTMLRI